MKNIIYTFIVILLCSTLQSCIYEYNEKPSETRIGHEIASEAVRHICTTAKLTELARIVDLWQCAETNEEKYAIEDFYFEVAKIRQLSEDTVKVGILYKINTFGKPLHDTPWQMIPANSEYGENVIYEVRFVDKDIYQVELIESNNESTVLHTVSIVEENKQYRVESVAKGIPTNRLCFHNQLDYNTALPLTIKTYLSSPVPLWQPYYEITDGQLEINVYTNGTPMKQDETHVTFNWSRAKINFRDNSDYYTGLDCYTILF